MNAGTITTSSGPTPTTCLAICRSPLGAYCVGTSIQRGAYAPFPRDCERVATPALGLPSGRKPDASTRHSAGYCFVPDCERVASTAAPLPGFCKATHMGARRTRCFRPATVFVPNPPGDPALSSNIRLPGSRAEQFALTSVSSAESPKSPGLDWRPTRAGVTSPAAIRCPGSVLR